MDDSIQVIKYILEKMIHTDCIVSISHSDYRKTLGGTEKFIMEEQQELDKRDISYIHLFPFNGGADEWLEPALELLGMTVDSDFIGYFTAAHVKVILLSIRETGINIVETHIHHVLGMKMGTIQEVLYGSKAQVKFFIHDYFSVCPEYHLLKNEQKYCGVPAPGSADCESCCYGKQRIFNLPNFYNFFIKNNISFIAPSEKAKEVWARAYPQLVDRVRIVEHQKLKGIYNRKIDLSNRKVKVAFIGSRLKNKGWEVFSSLIDRINRSAYELYYFGTGEKIKAIKNVHVSFKDDGTDAMIKALRKNEIDIVVLWSIWPETYCYTYYESLAAGCFVVTCSDSGNIAAQVEKNKNGVVLRSEEELINFFNDYERIGSLIVDNYGSAFPLTLEVNSILAEEASEKSINKPKEETADESAVSKLLEEKEILEELIKEQRVTNQVYYMALKNIKLVNDIAQTIKVNRQKDILMTQILSSNYNEVRRKQQDPQDEEWSHNPS